MTSLNEDTLYFVLSYIASLPPPQNAHQLARLALVSKDWHATATSLLYREPAMMEVIYVYKMAQLQRTLENNKELAAKVKVVNFSGQGRVEGGWSQSSRPPVEALEETVKLCTSAQGVTLYGCTNVFLRSYLDAILRFRPAITSLAISPLDPGVAYFVGAGMNSKIHYSRIGTTLSVAYLASRLAGLPHLETLYLTELGPGVDVEWIPPTFTLRKLALVGCSLLKEDLETLLSSSSSSLRALHLALYYSGSGPRRSLKRSELGPILRSTVAEKLEQLFLIDSDMFSEGAIGTESNGITISDFPSLLSCHLHFENFQDHPFLKGGLPPLLRRLTLFGVSKRDESAVQELSRQHPLVQVDYATVGKLVQPFEIRKVGRVVVMRAGEEEGGDGNGLGGLERSKRGPIVDEVDQMRDL